jgi:RNA polymerase sigma-70 factor (ECF subfamily)
MTDPFAEHRDLLFTVAYEMLGSAADAEDVVQEAWLRWREVDPEEIDNPRAYAVRIVTRLALNQMRTLSRRRESYVGPWLPEPLLTEPDVADDVVLSESVSMAMLVVMESLSPTERRVRAARGVRLRARRDRHGRRQEPRRRTPDRAPRPRARAGQAS